MWIKNSLFIFPHAGWRTLESKTPRSMNNVCVLVCFLLNLKHSQSHIATNRSLCFSPRHPCRQKQGKRGINWESLIHEWTDGCPLRRGVKTWQRVVELLAYELAGFADRGPTQANWSCTELQWKTAESISQSIRRHLFRIQWDGVCWLFRARSNSLSAAANLILSNTYLP